MATYTTMEGPQHIAIRELDLRTCHPSTMVDRVGAVPVLKTSAGKFLSFLVFCFVFSCWCCPLSKSPVTRLPWPPSKHTPVSTLEPGSRTRQCIELSLVLLLQSQHLSFEAIHNAAHRLRRCHDGPPSAVSVVHYIKPIRLWSNTRTKMLQLEHHG